MNLLRLPMILLMTGVLGMAGCSVHQPAALYQLDSGEPGQPKQSSGLAVLLGPVSIADYLQRETLLQRQPDGTLTASADGRWAGNLASDIDQLLLRQVSWKLDSQRVVLAPAVANFSPDVQVLLSITRLDSGARQPAILDAQWRLLDRKGNVRDSRLVHLEEVHNGSTASQVKAQGILLQRLAEQVSTAIKPISWQVDEPKKAAPVVRNNKQAEKPKIPMASPIRTDLEVFRF
ncbi:ABC-type transport auxiliary lipoprotein family protein [Pseudomonas sp. DTU_2021_1001937_2_SI_NGA_ILE_001]|uniref:PqiC family protein n=1 Tax=Pseudomonas sp. DTU_2021_1001937_2_SI_NGA_ILE_001 TaxID=3077589 RepID=UPI0025F9D561|nr:ABC-type transport auxiliary lipoprotein family protein [Pseudomonas sp. DTU_2021_1001937_2_SI_NGA_ILE_001]WNW13104.1 ABC-type transport auxiliary lipoprotein family protein [Pseudomonas sp. DTU_2021_1001937_2_SI_NGA_ILE_001]